VLTRFELGEDGSTLTDMTQCTSSPQVSRVPLGLSQPAWNDEGILPFSSQIFEPKQRRWQSRERSCSIEARLVTREVAGKGLTPGQGTPAELEGCKERRNRRRMDASGGMYVKGGVKRHTLR